MTAPNTAFSAAVIRWQKQHGRHSLPWQCDDPYKVWLSEIMLQQTQVTMVIPYYQRFLCRFPNVHRLARAHAESVMAVWSGLGYYARARHLHAAAKIIARIGFPQTVGDWQSLPGVGRSTAAAIVVFTVGDRHAVLDGNVKRVLARAFAVEQPINQVSTVGVLWELADSLLPKRDIKAYTQGLMDLGAAVCVRARPHCEVCPLAAQCLARRRGLDRQLPHRRSRAAKPTRHTIMMLIYHHHRVLLQKRPPTGIWGGLWSLPEVETPPRHYCRQFGNTLILQGETAFIHTFTHYRLQARVLLYVCRKSPVPHSAVKWTESTALAGIALPAPLKRLLMDFFAQQT